MGGNDFGFACPVGSWRRQRRWRHATTRVVRVVTRGKRAWKNKGDRSSSLSHRGWRSVASVEETRLRMTIHDVGGRGEHGSVSPTPHSSSRARTSFVPFLVTDARTHARAHAHSRDPEPLTA